MLIDRKMTRRLDELREMGAEAKFAEMGLKLTDLTDLRDVNYFYALATRDMLRCGGASGGRCTLCLRARVTAASPNVQRCAGAGASRAQATVRRRDSRLGD